MGVEGETGAGPDCSTITSKNDDSIGDPDSSSRVMGCPYATEGEDVLGPIAPLRAAYDEEGAVDESDMSKLEGSEDATSAKGRVVGAAMGEE